jgi:type IV pilus assembly protein PilW
MMYSTSFNKHTQSGFTFVEMMVAMVLSMILLGGVIQIMSSTKQSYRIHEGVSQMQENGRFAVEILSRDIRMADFWGCADTIGKVTNNLNPAGGAGYINYAAGGLGGADGGAGNPDTLIIRGAFNTGLAVTPPFGPQPSAQISTAAGNGLNQFDIILISDCTAADIFQITNANPDGSGQLVHNTGVGAPGNFNASNPGCPGANAHCLSKVYGADATIFGVQQVTYTIANGGSGQPALFRNGTELVDGIEDMQILYGEDTDGSGSANRYVRADQVADMNVVVSLRLALVARSYDNNLTNTAQAYTVMGNALNAADRRLRQVYTATVGIRNRLR